MKINDNWYAEGTSKELFLSELNEMAEKTALEEARIADINILSCLRKDNTGRCPQYHFVHLDMESVCKAENAQKMFDRKVLPAATKEAMDILDDIQNGTGMLINFPQLGPFVFSRHALFDFAKMLGLNGDALKMNCFERDLFFEKCCISYASINNSFNGEIRFIYRKGAGFRKIFSVSKSENEYFPINNMEILVNTAVIGSETTGAGIVRHWEINHKKALIRIEYPELADRLHKDFNLAVKMIPGVEISDSDIGMSSLTIATTMRLEPAQHPVYMAIHKTKHTKAIEYADLCRYILVNMPSQYEEGIRRFTEEKDPIAELKKSAKKMLKDTDLFTAIGSKRCKNILDIITEENPPKDMLELKTRLLLLVDTEENDSKENRRKAAKALGLLFGIKEVAA